MENSFDTLTSSFSKSAPSGDDSNVLGVIRYGTRFTRPELQREVPLLNLNITGSTTEEFFEVWRTNKPVLSSSNDGVIYSHSEDVLFCTADIPNSGSVEEATLFTYLKCFSLMKELGFNNIFRMWNFIPNINAHNSDGLEVYRDFCLGRATAFEEHARHHRILMPAATGIGSLGGGIGLYFLASRTAECIHVENPRQLPAFTYPRKHGPKSPSFARASFLGFGSGMIFVSGTASILGHETVFEGDIEKQCEVTLQNISLLISHQNCLDHGLLRGATLQDLDQIKVYVRNSGDIARVREICGAAFSPGANIVYLNVDICRSSLLVEIEGVVQQLTSVQEPRDELEVLEA